MTNSNGKIKAAEFRGRVLADLEYLKKGQSKFVTLARYKPVEALVYGFTGLIITAVILALLNQVVK